ncbi:hypothetical protein IV203_000017 [Nitzschia inconspicua]|uniref:Uncharacterized protein n=1 Tax=Nitzschia inconspicua TaxID=303405 RepID=A0A9K3K6Q5_9STRA|nr:hypothetical protein IV203_000017 [Nitzschia inconspicua]
MDVISSFRPVPAVRYSSRVVIARMSLANENAILKIQKEYGQLREKLRQGLLHEGEGVDVDPIAFTQELLEKATDMVALQRYQQEEIIMKAAKELRHARSDHVLADAVQQQAHEEYEMAQEALQQLESFEDSVSGYEDRERLRDMSVAHAASHVEHDARELSLESQFQELEASEKQDRAVEFLHRLEEIEEELHDTLIAVMKFKNEHAMEEWAKNEAPKHEEFLGILNTQFNNMNGDLSS